MGFNRKILSLNSVVRGCRGFANERTRILFFRGKLNLLPESIVPSIHEIARGSGFMCSCPLACHGLRRSVRQHLLASSLENSSCRIFQVLRDFPRD